MHAYVEELLARLGTEATHAEAVEAFEAFKVETTSRRVLQELLDYFHGRDVENHRIVREVREESERQTKRLDEVDKLVRAAAVSAKEAQENSKRMIRLEQKVQVTIEKTAAKGELFADKLQAH